jgi:hypothetical protein
MLNIKKAVGPEPVVCPSIQKYIPTCHPIRPFNLCRTPYIILMKYGKKEWLNNTKQIPMSLNIVSNQKVYKTAHIHYFLEVSDLRKFRSSGVPDKVASSFAGSKTEGGDGQAGGI